MGLFNILKGEQPVSTFISMVAHRESLDLGNTGEYLCAYAIERSGLAERGRLYRNLIVPTGPRSRLETTEIDVVLLHPTGIYVIESKNYSGWIFGKADQRNWTVCLNRNTKERVPNPIRQNNGHISALMRVLDLLREAFVSLIVFSERCEFKRIPDDTDSTLIIHRNRMVKRIKEASGRRGVIFTPEKMEDYRRALDSVSTLSTADARARHVESLKASIGLKASIE